MAAVSPCHSNGSVSPMPDDTSTYGDQLLGIIGVFLGLRTVRIITPLADEHPFWYKCVRVVVVQLIGRKGGVNSTTKGSLEARRRACLTHGRSSCGSACMRSSGAS